MQRKYNLKNTSSGGVYVTKEKLLEVSDLSISFQKKNLTFRLFKAFLSPSIKEKSSELSGNPAAAKASLPLP